MKTYLSLAFLVMIALMTRSESMAALDDNAAGPKIVVTRALFGSGLNTVDVTKRVAELLDSEPDGFAARADWLRSDPAPAKAKALAITYDYKGRHYLFVTVWKEKLTKELLIENAKKSDTPPPTDAL